MMARKRSPIPRFADDCSREAAAKRIEFVGTATGARPGYIAAQVPIGIGGPLPVSGERARGEFCEPPATTEGTLVAAYNRGIKLPHAAGGVQTTVMDDRMRRAPSSGFDSARQELAEIVAATDLCGELSLGSAIVAGEWAGAHERLGRDRPASRSFNSEKEASWTG